MKGRTEGGQHQVPHIWAQPAVPQLGLEAAQWVWVQRYLQPPPSQGYIPLLTPQNPPTAAFTF